MPGGGYMVGHGDEEDVSFLSSQHSYLSAYPLQLYSLFRCGVATLMAKDMMVDEEGTDGCQVMSSVHQSILLLRARWISDFFFFRHLALSREID